LIYDVVIAGAGPVGLFLACELRLTGLSVLVLEQAEESSMGGLPRLERPAFGSTRILRS
jgi:2-polyprenyl-6-methoxyphenol hydroxylase-like FAD-dependent oxidoreductase